VDYHSVNRKSLESLIKAGVFDRFHERNLLLDNIELIIAFATRSQKQAKHGQTDLFGGKDKASVARGRLNLPPALADQSKQSRENLIWERELLGLYLSKHPLTLYERYLKDKTRPIGELNQNLDGESVQIGGIVNGVREITTKNGQRMAFVRIEDLSGDIEVILFPSNYSQYGSHFTLDKVLIVRGKLSAKDRDGRLSSDLKVLLDSASEITPDDAEAYGQPAKAEAATPVVLSGPGAKGADSGQRLFIRLESSDNERLLIDLKRTIDNHRGSTEVVLVLGEEQTKQAIKLPAGIELDSEGPRLLKELMGSENVAFN
ncbi:MAG: OB-fold nucleic acid binding domain-containing protein, partial [Candidatus Saccharimonadales bacterium]